MADYNLEPRPPARQRSTVLPHLLIAVLVAGVVSTFVTVVLNLILVPSGIGWRKLVHEGTVTIPGGGQPFTVEYPSSFSGKPSLSLEVIGNDVWYYRIDEATSNHFTITNTTIAKRDGLPVMLTLRWRAEGGRW